MDIFTFIYCDNCNVCFVLTKINKRVRGCAIFVKLWTVFKIIPFTNQIPEVSVNVIFCHQGWTWRLPTLHRCSDVKFSLKDAILLINVVPVFLLKDADLSFKVVNVVPFLSMLRLRLDWWLTRHKSAESLTCKMITSKININCQIPRFCTSVIMTH